MSGNIHDRLAELARISDEPDALTRAFLSPALKRSHALVRKWMEATGLAVHCDAGGNLIGRREATEGAAGAKTLVVGSHLDTVRAAGLYDGPLGVLAGIAVAAELAETPLPFALEVVGFSDEEGLRYQTAYLGSRFYSGRFPAEWLELTDAENIPLRQAAIDWGSDPADFLEQEPREDLLGYLELHIEQGPVLEQENLSVGVVTAIAGQSRVALKLTGAPGHAGTTPMTLRRDALAGAAEFIAEVERVGHRHPESLGLVATVGQLTVEPGASNVIPGRTEFTLDLRHPDNAVREAALAELETAFKRIAAERRLDAVWIVRQENPAVPCDARFIEALVEAASHEQAVVPELVSGAGHDAVALSPLCPVGMLFVTCRDGLSHHPDEFTAPEHIDVAVAVLTRAVRALAEDI